MLKEDRTYKNKIDWGMGKKRKNFLESIEMKKYGNEIV